MGNRDRTATPFHLPSPAETTVYPRALISASGKPSGATLVSCRQTTSGFVESSQASTRGSLARIELTFQVASRMIGSLPEKAGAEAHSTGHVRRGKRPRHPSGLRTASGSPDRRTPLARFAPSSHGG